MDGAIPLAPPQTSDEPMADAPTTHPYTVGNDRDNDSDWEYEYDPTETETQYIILDISSSQPVGAYPGKRRPRNDDTQPQQTRPQSSAPPSSSAQPQPATESSPPITAPPPPPHLPQIALKNLHTPTPHLTHNNTLYHCSWSTPLGTDLLLASSSPPSTSNAPDINILGLSRLRLTARPIAHLQPPRNIPTRFRAPTTGRPVIERRERQVGFLERLTEVKRARGEGGEVSMVGRGRGRGRGRGVGRRVRRMEDVGVEVGDSGRRVRWGDGVDDGVEEDRGLGEQQEQHEEEARLRRLREVVGDEEILQGEEEEEEEEEIGGEGSDEGEEGRDRALAGEEEVGMGDFEGAEEAADVAINGGLPDDDDEDVAMGENR